MDNIAGLADRYDVNLATLVVVYFSSVIPIYLGLFLMLLGLGISFKLSKVASLVQDISSGLRENRARPIFYLGLFMHFFGWGMPYLYVIWATSIISVYLKIICVLILAAVLMFFGRKRFYPVTKFVGPVVKIEKMEIVDPSLHGILWKIYDDEFMPVNEKSPCRQSFHEDDFKSVLSRRDVLKYVIWKEGHPIGLAMLTNNLANSTWISQDFFMKRYPVEYKDGRLYYFLGIVLSNKFRRRGLALECIKNIFVDLPKNIIVGFDHSVVVNKHIGKFPIFLQVLHKIKLRRRYLDSMKYYVVEIGGRQ